MDAVDIPADRVPEGLKACEQILKRGKEVRKVEPIVTYWCCFAAAQKALDMRNRSKEDTAFLMALLDALEQMKTILADEDAVTTEAAGAAYIENFALKVFMGADNEDRKGNTGKATIRKFVVAGQFIEVLRCFENGMTEEMEQKLQYARWKAADGAKALREGRLPNSGPPIPDIEPALPELPVGSPSTSSQHLSATPTQASPLSKDSTLGGSSTPIVSPRPSPLNDNRANLPGLDVSGDVYDERALGRAGSTPSGAWSTMATPGLADDDDDEDRRFRLPTVPPAQPSERPQSLPAGEKRTVRFMGPDGAPLSPAQTHLTVDSYDAPDAPPSSTFGDDADPPPLIPSAPPMSKEGSSSSSRSATAKNPNQSSEINSSSPGRTRVDSVSAVIDKAGGSSTMLTDAPLKSGTPSSGSGFLPSLHAINAPPPPPPSLASYPSAPPPTAHPHGLGLTSPSPSAPHISALPPQQTKASRPSAPSAPASYEPAPAPVPTPKLTRKQVEQTQKHARWAISALEFDDTETARSELRKALALLGG